jgi:hypothetical protein
LPNRPAPSQPPTARTFFQLIRNMAVITLSLAGRSLRQVTALRHHQLHVISLLDYEPSIYQSPHRKYPIMSSNISNRVHISHHMLGCNRPFGVFLRNLPKVHNIRTGNLIGVIREGVKFTFDLPGGGRWAALRQVEEAR